MGECGVWGCEGGGECVSVGGRECVSVGVECVGVWCVGVGVGECGNVSVWGWG